MDQTACKPGSVPPRAEARDATIIPLDRPSRDGSRDLPGPPRPTTALPSLRRAHGPYSVLLLAGLAMPSLSPGTRWALTPPFHPYPSNEGRFAFCGAIPGVAPGGRYPPPCRGGARTFLDPLAGAAIARPSGPGRNLRDGRPWVKFSHASVIPVSPELCGMTPRERISS